MIFPSASDYQNMVAIPHRAFKYEYLKNCLPETDKFGMPKPYSGSFNVTFHFNHKDKKSKSFAIRCFTNEVSNADKKYKKICNHISLSKNSSFMDCKYVNEGIWVNGSWYPIVIMEWAKGKNLNLFVEENLDKPAIVKNLAGKLYDLALELENQGIAHGDLQHGNIIARNNMVNLIDYDGFYLPSLSNYKPSDLGHVNYQHPKRNNKNFDKRLDYFSFHVIYTGLLATAESPDLWTKYNNGENILFTKKDFINPGSSELISDIEKIPSLKKNIRVLKRLCNSAYDKIPSLSKSFSRIDSDPYFPSWVLQAKKKDTKFTNKYFNQKEKNTRNVMPQWIKEELFQ